ncbi:MAG: hypothetical protein J6D21_12025 [Clostridia bacterium]|nr:hypothetical protein [Clostridia bacterium]
MEKSFPFNAKYAGSSFDRVYSADDWAAERAAYIGNGILVQSALAVTPAGGMAISVAPGNASINGRTYFNTTPLTKTLSSSAAANRRIDLVVLRLDTEAREMYVAIKSSPFSLSPTCPEPTVSETVTEIPLAEVSIGLDATAITAADITDRRVLAKYPLNYDQIYEEFVEDLKERLGLEQLSDAGVFTQMLTNAGSGAKALFDDGTYKAVPQVVTGTCSLTSSSDGSFTVNLGMKPQAVLYCRMAHPFVAYENSTLNVYGGLTTSVDCCARYDSTSSGNISLLSLTDTGFRVSTNRNNTTGHQYMAGTYKYGGVSGGNNEYVGVYMAII